MNPVFTFVLGLLIGWLIEWVIDYFYWRTRRAENGGVQPRQAVARRAMSPESPVSQPASTARDDLKVIKGIGPVIERKLNQADIYTFDQLGSLTVAQLRRILGNSIERLSDEESLLQQARDLARQK